MITSFPSNNTGAGGHFIVMYKIYRNTRKNASGKWETSNHIGVAL